MSLRTLEFRLQKFKEENEILERKLEDKMGTIKDLETKIQITTLEIAKKSGKLNQMMSTTHIIQSQLERLREEHEEEKLSSSREISHLNAIISEKNSIIERLRAEGTFEADKQVFEAGLTLESTGGFDSTLETDLEPSFDPTGILFDSTNKEPNNKLSPRGAGPEGFAPTEILNQLGTFNKKESFSKNDTEAIIPLEGQQGSSQKTMVDKGSQTDPHENKASRQMLAKSTQAIDESHAKSKQMVEAVSKADQERLQSLEVELKETLKLADFYKKSSVEKDNKIEALYESMRSMSEENSKIINELTIEFEQASSMLRKARSL